MFFLIFALAILSALAHQHGGHPMGANHLATTAPSPTGPQQERRSLDSPRRGNNVVNLGSEYTRNLLCLALPNASCRGRVKQTCGH
jgi:hypothetical protein